MRGPHGQYKSMRLKQKRASQANQQINRQCLVYFDYFAASGDYRLRYLHSDRSSYLGATLESAEIGRSSAGRRLPRWNIEYFVRKFAQH